MATDNLDRPLATRVMHRVLDLNWRRGLFRAWIVLAVAYWLLCLANEVRIWIVYGEPPTAVPIDLDVEVYGLPFALLGAGYLLFWLVSWVAKGFRR
jgi:hypothetical protein